MNRERPPLIKAFNVTPRTVARGGVTAAARYSTVGRGERWQWLPPVVGLGLGLAVIGVLGAQSVRFGDAADYTAAARSLLEGNGYPREASLPFFRPPLYPFFLAAIELVAPDNVPAVKLVQALLFSATCWLLYHLAAQVTGSRQAALVGGLLYAVNPFALVQVADIQTEVLHAFLVAAGMLALSRIFREGTPSRRGSLLAGGAFGLAALCRPTALPVGVALALAVWWIARREAPRRHARASAGLMMAGMALAIAPWTVANWRATGAPLLITDATGYHLWMGNHPAAIRLYEGRFSSRQAFDDFGYGYLQRDLPQARIREWEESAGYRTLSLQQRERLWRREALETMRRNPGLTLRLWAGKTWAYWKPWLHPQAYSRRLVLASGAAMLTLYLLAALGAVVLARECRGRRFLVLLAFLFVSSTLAHTITHSMVRFRLPYVDPYLSVLAGVALWSAVLRLIDAKRTETVPGAAALASQSGAG